MKRETVLVYNRAGRDVTTNGCLRLDPFFFTDLGDEKRFTYEELKDILIWTNKDLECFVGYPGYWAEIKCLVELNMLFQAPIGEVVEFLNARDTAQKLHDRLMEFRRKYEVPFDG